MHLRPPIGSAMPQDGRVQPNWVAKIACSRRGRRNRGPQVTNVGWRCGEYLL
jgi:hypothetical protein